MGLSSRILRIPKPRKFLYALSLPTGASLITLSLLLNKLSGFYGILALFTGFHLSPFQLSMYIYSLCALALTVYLMPYIKTSTTPQVSPVHCMALAWFYVLDSAVNAAYTAAFAVTWFLVLIQHHAGEAPSKGPGAGTIGDTSGFTDPVHNVSNVEIVDSQPSGSFISGENGALRGNPADAPAGVGNATVSDVVWGRESINSVGIIVALWTLRAYFVLVMLSWARAVLRTYIAVQAAKNPNTDFTAASRDGNMAENPFELGKPDGEGWKGKLGRAMISMSKGYWLGGSDIQDEAWMNSMDAKFGQRRSLAGHNASVSSTSGGARQTNDGVVLGKINSERENRRRSGTGPPLPSVQAAAGRIDDGEPETFESTKMLKVPSQ